MKDLESIVLISPCNEVLLLARTLSSSAFPSAHVFPGGTLDAAQDGDIPEADHPSRHRDGLAYRLAAIRETFEESGILLVRRDQSSNLKGHVEITKEEREKARRDVHAGQVRFRDVLANWRLEADVDGLVPFTRWITPEAQGRWKRFSTMMYLYFLPLETWYTGSGPLQEREQASSSTSPSPAAQHVPSASAEHTSVRFAPAHAWLSLAQRNEITLFPPQFLLLHIIAPFLSPAFTATSSSPSQVQSDASINASPTDTLLSQRNDLVTYLRTPLTYDGEPEPSWSEACISPRVVPTAFRRRLQDAGLVGKEVSVFGLDWPGKEVEGEHEHVHHEGGAVAEKKEMVKRRGLKGWVMGAKFEKGGAVRGAKVWRREALLEALGDENADGGDGMGQGAPKL